MVTLPKVLIEELEKKARELGVSISELLFSIVAKSSDPNFEAGKYLDGALELLEQARQELIKGNLRQASEKVWGSCALTLKAHALFKKGKRIESHKELWVYKNEVARELGEWVKTVFRQADSMHKNFYENLATKEDVEDVLREIEKLVKTISDHLRKSE
ncbi:hypothetical protein CW703_06955 [Candidatus Bathyarchaeota archaeon]|nr:MAG: hypothetical protein CW703_06955 [Candidatus Bathyarchaeota archaeon]